MKNILSLLLPLALFSLTSGEFCFDNLKTYCTHQGLIKTNLPSCDSKYSGAPNVFSKLEELFQTQIDYSFQYLLMSVNFANYEKNREGFSKLYKKLSDDSWEDAIDLAKYVTKRGGFMTFANKTSPSDLKGINYEWYELESLARALDMGKHVGQKVHSIHSEVTNRHSDYHDAETLSYLENKFVSKHADSVRELAGYTNDLTKFIKKSKAGNGASLSVFLFDEYLQKTL